MRVASGYSLKGMSGRRGGGVLCSVELQTGNGRSVFVCTVLKTKTTNLCVLQALPLRAAGTFLKTRRKVPSFDRLKCKTGSVVAFLTPRARFELNTLSYRCWCASLM